MRLTTAGAAVLQPLALRATPTSANCTQYFFTQPLDHFSDADTRTFEQRYFVCGAEHRQAKDDPIFFYVGNEADVTLYVNATGLMWESATEFKAAMVFAEHRYFGQSLPPGAAARKNMRYLSTEQALADYARLIFALRHPQLFKANNKVGSTITTSTNPTFTPQSTKNTIPVSSTITTTTATSAAAAAATTIPLASSSASRVATFRFGAPTVSAFIGFGGSYGGMLASWLRLKYPSAIAGAVAASAPIESFLGESPPYDTLSFGKTVTLDASVEGGAAAKCTDAVRDAWKAMWRLAATPTGCSAIGSAMRLCPDSMPVTAANVTAVAEWAQSSMDYMAMGSYPYPSSYLLNGDGVLPAYPMRVMCRRILAKLATRADAAEAHGIGHGGGDAAAAAAAAARASAGAGAGTDAGTSTGAGAGGEGGGVGSRAGKAGKAGGTRALRSGSEGASVVDGDAFAADVLLVKALLEGINLFYNYSETKQCHSLSSSANNATAQDGLFWDYLYCTEMLQPMERDGVNDMFWPQPFNLTQVSAGCMQRWGVAVRPYWATVQYGGQRIRAASNIVWSNGGLDPWRGGGVTRNVSDSLVAIIIPNVGHHMDLMFSNPLDPPAVVAARELERTHMRRWVAEAAAAAAELETAKTTPAA